MKNLYAVLALCAALASVPTSPLNAQCTATAATSIPAGNWIGPPTVPASPVWAGNVPPAASGAALLSPPSPAHCTANPPYSTNCNVCPSTFRANIGPGANRAQVYLCAGNNYTISLCSSVPAWDSEITISNTTNTVLFGFDDDGCGTPGGHAQLNFIPPTSALYFIKIFAPGCLAPAVGQTGVLTIQCVQAPCPGDGNDPCTSTPLLPCNPNFTNCPANNGAIAFPALGPSCTTLTAATAGMNGTVGVAAPSCGSYPNSGDIWFTAVSSGTGTLALDIVHGSATNLAMALYSATGACPTPTLAQVSCNADLVAGTDLSPFISTSALTPNTLYYIRVWPESNIANGGSFQLCAYHPVPPPNDNCSGAIALDMSNPNCVSATFNTQDATNSTVGAPVCAAPATNDVWFRITVPAPGGRVTINTIAGSLTSMAMALYTGTCGALTEVACNDNNPAGGNMPFLNPATNYPTGTQLWVRMWSQTTGFGTFDICAYLTQPPANDEPCGAIPISPEYGCYMTGISTENASQTSTGVYGVGSVPNPSCGAAPLNDVWYSTVVPPNGQIGLDMDDAQMNDAAVAVYRRTSGGCPGGGNFVQVPGACFIGGSTNVGAGAMPAGTVTGLTPGETVYIRVWRQSGLSGTAHLCVRRTDTLPVSSGAFCYYTLRMTDTGGNGWNGSFVTIQIGAGAPVNYTINSGTGSISFPVNNLDPVTITYTAVGGFQNEISYLVVNQTNGLIFGSTIPPANGLNYVGAADCNAPPPPINDCVGSFRLCTGGTFTENPNNSGAVADLNAGNDGCLFGENQGAWYRFTPSSAGTLAFTIAPATATDYDFAMWGPNPGGPVCPPNTPPLRCSYAAGGGPTGLGNAAVDQTEGAGGDRWVQEVNPVTVGAYYWLYIDNFSRNGVNFTFTYTGTANISCTITPVDLLDFSAVAVGREVEVLWSTSAERSSSHFIVERSTDGTLFEPIGQVAAAMNSVVRTDYKFVDRSPANGINYYRLRQVDSDEAVHTTETVYVIFKNMGAPLFVFPNPTSEVLTASVAADHDGPVVWRVLDTSGRMVLEGRSASGNGRLDVPVVTLDGGSYLLELYNEQKEPMGNARFVKQ